MSLMHNFILNIFIAHSIFFLSLQSRVAADAVEQLKLGMREESGKKYQSDSIKSSSCC